MWRREKWYGSTADVCHSLVQPPANVISLGYRYLEREHRTVSQSIFSRLRPLLDAKMSCCNWFVRSNRSVVVNFVLAVRVGTEGGLQIECRRRNAGVAVRSTFFCFKFWYF